MEYAFGNRVDLELHARVQEAAERVMGEYLMKWKDHIVIGANDAMSHRNAKQFTPGGYMKTAYDETDCIKMMGLWLDQHIEIGDFLRMRPFVEGDTPQRYWFDKDVQKAEAEHRFVGDMQSQSFRSEGSIVGPISG